MINHVVLKLNNTLLNRKKESCLSKFEIMFDDLDNYDTLLFMEKVESELEYGKTYRITIQEI